MDEKIEMKSGKVYDRPEEIVPNKVYQCNSTGFYVMVISLTPGHQSAFMSPRPGQVRYLYTKYMREHSQQHLSFVSGIEHFKDEFHDTEFTIENFLLGEV